MGYQAGQGLGSRATGRAEPILVDLKVSKAGLGIDEARRRRQQDADVARKETGDESSCCSRFLTLLCAVHTSVAHRIKLTFSIKLSQR